MKKSLKSTPPRSRPIGGIRTSLTSEVTIVPNAAPMITPTARSTTLPRMTNVLNSLSMGLSPVRAARARGAPSWPTRSAHTLQWAPGGARGAALQNAGELPDSLPVGPPDRFPGILLAPYERRHDARLCRPGRRGAAAHGLHLGSPGYRVEEAGRHVPGRVPGRGRMRPEGVRDRTGAGSDSRRTARRWSHCGSGVAAG